MMLDTQEPPPLASESGRPYVEFLQSQVIDWTHDILLTGRDATEVKLLSRDARTGATTMLWRLPPGWTAGRDEWCSADEEIFVLEGGLSVNGRDYGRHHYAYWPTGFVRCGYRVGSKGLTAIVCTSAAPRYRDDINAAPVHDPAALSV